MSVFLWGKLNCKLTCKRQTRGYKENLRSWSRKPGSKCTNQLVDIGNKVCNMNRMYMEHIKLKKKKISQ